jgi:branched-chain amino acid transport system permease protein
MNAFILILLTGISVGCLYFLLASGLALIFGLMNVLSFAHGALLTFCGYVSWTVVQQMGAVVGWPGFFLALFCGAAAGAIASYMMELLVLRRLFGRPLEQLLATVGIGIAAVALMEGLWGPDELLMTLPPWLSKAAIVGAGIVIPNNRFVIILFALLVLAFLLLFLTRTRQGIIIRAGVENREMVQALGIDVQRSFSLVFAIAGGLAGLAGGVGLILYRAINPGLGDSVLIFAFIVLIVGGIGSVTGAAVAALMLGIIQAMANFYIGPGAGDMLVVVTLAVTLLVRPAGLMGRKGRIA